MNADETANIFVSGRKMRVSLHPSISGKDLKKGQDLVLNEALNIIEAREFDLQGEVVQLKLLLENKQSLSEFET